MLQDWTQSKLIKKMPSVPSWLSFLINKIGLVEYLLWKLMKKCKKTLSSVPGSGNYSINKLITLAARSNNIRMLEHDEKQRLVPFENTGKYKRKMATVLSPVEWCTTAPFFISTEWWGWKTLDIISPEPPASHRRERRLQHTRWAKPCTVDLAEPSHPR